MNETDTFIDVACASALQGAAEYLLAHNIDRSSLDRDKLLTTLTGHISACMESALTDANAAFQAHMPEVANATFVASMRLAGIRAVKEMVTN